MIHEVDELLEKLVKKDALNGSSVELVFDAPTKDWVARRNGPAVDLYLYDIREDLQRRVPAWEDQRGPDGTVNARSLPPRRFKLSYLVTAPIMVTRVAPYGPPVRSAPQIGLAAQGEPELFAGNGNGKGGKHGKAGAAVAVATPAETEEDEGAVGGKVLELIPSVADPAKPTPGMSLRVRTIRRR